MIKDYLSENIHKITEKKNFSFIPYFQKLFKLFTAKSRLFLITFVISTL